MLVLTRKIGASVICKTADGQEITVTVCEIFVNRETGGRRVRLGFEADKSINIRRTEIPDEADGTA
jgi:carbon storage regulator CsrA